jgi:hypothetical protein
VHDFWSVDGFERRQAEMTNSRKNATLFGAALVLAAYTRTAWLYTLDIGL